MATPLDIVQERLDRHFAGLAAQRSVLSQPLFALEHNLSSEEFDELSLQMRARGPSHAGLRPHWLAWVVFAAEFGYRYEGDEYWPEFERGITGWLPNTHRSQLKTLYKRFAERYGGVRPSGRWADWFTIISWPITHAILPKYLQLQFARVLHAARYDLAGLASVTPSAAGHLLSNAAYDASIRFQEFLEQEELAGVILLAMLADKDTAASSAVYPPTLERIVRDLEKERLAREYLKEARNLIAPRFKGAGRPGRDDRPYLARDRGSQPGSIRPALLLRRTGRAKWSPLLDFPSFVDIGKLDVASRHYIKTTRCKISSADDAWLPAGWLEATNQMRVLRSWPPADRPLLRFERTDNQPGLLRNILDTECRLTPGPKWVLRVRADGMAVETPGRTVRPGQTYIILFHEELAATGLLSPCEIECANVKAVQLDMPSVLTHEQIAQLEGLGLKVSRSIEIWPAGMPGRGWDGEGESEWLTTEAPCFGLSHDHPVDHFILRLNSGPEMRVAARQGALVFIRSSPLAAGTHTLTINAQRNNAPLPDTTGRINLRVREPRTWSPGVTAHAGLAVAVDPPDASLDDLLSGALKLSIVGPDHRQVRVDIALRNPHGADVASEKICSHELPVAASVLSDSLRAFQERRGWMLVEASSAVVQIAADELGRFTFRLERNLRPLRWICRLSRSAIIRLVDDTGDEGDAKPELRYFTFRGPTCATPVSFEAALAGFSVQGQGGLYFARFGVHVDSVMVNQVSGGLQNLKTSPELGQISPGPTSARTLLGSMQLWAEARLAGSLAGIQRQHTVECLHRAMIEALCGRKWVEAERAFDGGRKSDDAIDALKSHVDNSRFAAALKSRAPEIDEGEKGRRLFAEIAARYEVTSDRHECEFAMIWAADPLRLLKICKNVDDFLATSAHHPVLLRGARLLALIASRMGMRP